MSEKTEDTSFLDDVGNLLKKPFSGEHRTAKIIATLAVVLALPSIGSALRSDRHVETGVPRFPVGHEQGVDRQPVLHEGQFDPGTIKDTQNLEKIKNQ